MNDVPMIATSFKNLIEITPKMIAKTAINIHSTRGLGEILYTKSSNNQVAIVPPSQQPRKNTPILKNLARSAPTTKPAIADATSTTQPTHSGVENGKIMAYITKRTATMVVNSIIINTLVFIKYPPTTTKNSPIRMIAGVIYTLYL